MPLQQHALHDGVINQCQALGLRPMAVQVEKSHGHHRTDAPGSGTVHADITAPAPFCGQAA